MRATIDHYRRLNQPLILIFYDFEPYFDKFWEKDAGPVLCCSSVSIFSDIADKFNLNLFDIKVNPLEFVDNIVILVNLYNITIPQNALAVTFQYKKRLKVKPKKKMFSSKSEAEAAVLRFSSN